MPLRSKVSVCGSRAFGSGNGYSVISPVFGSSLPISPELLPVNQRLPRLSAVMPCGPVCGVLSLYSLAWPVFWSIRPTTFAVCPEYQIMPSGVAHGSCGREPGVGTGHSVIAACTAPETIAAAGFGFSGNDLIRYSVTTGHCSGVTGASMFCIIWTTDRHPSGV